MSSQTDPVLKISDLDLMPDDGNRYELIEGELFVSRAPSLLHQLAITNLIVLVRSYLDLNPIGIVVTGPGVILSEVSGVIPDLVFISNERLTDIVLSDRLTGAPELVVEILSPGSENERRDRVVKRSLYGKYGVQEYWVVDLVSRSIEIYTLNRRLLVLSSTLTEGDELNSGVLPGFRCEVRRILPA